MSQPKSLVAKSLAVSIAHDYLCPWCWVGFFQAQKLKQEFPQITLDWQGYELLPEELGDLPVYEPKPKNSDTPPSRFEQFAASEGVTLHKRPISIVRTHAPLEGAEWVKDRFPDKFDAYNEAVYRAFWERGDDISNLDILGNLVASVGIDDRSDVSDFLSAIVSKKYYDKIVRFDADAYADDVTHVPTFRFRGERCAEAPYATIREMASRFLVWYNKD